MQDTRLRQNYDRKMTALLDGLKAAGNRPRLLLHSCCAPCSTAVLERLHEGLDLTLFFYNPNIDTQEEHDLRARELSDLAGESGWAPTPVVVPYDPATYYAAVKGLEKEPEGGLRCRKCFELRLRATARYAKSNGYDCFTTTLTISPMKDAQALNALGEQIAAEEGVHFLNSDFKKQGGYQRSIALSRDFGLYRQDYCGCVFSKRDARVAKPTE